MGHKTYTQQPIKGELPEITLPEGCALICEGGGTRGYFSGGVFEAFMDEGIMFPYIIGVSAGAANPLSYISGQKLRNRQILENYVTDRRYVSKGNFLKTRSMFGMDFIFHTIPGEHVYFDWKTFKACQTRFLAGAMDCATGKTVWFEKEDIDRKQMAVIASCSIPILSPIVRYKGYELLDGGVSDPIPIDQSIADGNTFHVIVLTRNEGYVKKEFAFKSILKRMYRDYPEVVNAVLRRHETYNRQVALCEELEREGKAIIIRPQKPLQVDRSSTDVKKLLDLYDEGHQEGRKAVRKLREMGILTDIY